MLTASAQTLVFSASLANTFGVGVVAILWKVTAAGDTLLINDVLPGTSYVPGQLKHLTYSHKIYLEAGEKIDGQAFLVSDTIDVEWSDMFGDLPDYDYESLFGETPQISWAAMFGVPAQSIDPSTPLVDADFSFLV